MRDDVRAGKWLLREPAKEAQARLFCIPYSGCGASTYRRWPEFLDDIEICPVQPPGRENRLRERSYGSYEELAGGLLSALGGYLDRPYALFGHCGSALAAYESAIQTEGFGLRPPTRLFVSSQVAPHEGPYSRFLTMSDAELTTELAALFTALGGKPRPDLIELSLRVLKADLAANKRYHKAEPVRASFPITAIGWTKDVEVAHSLMDGWKTLGGPTTFELLDGDHYSFLNGPADLLAVFRRDLGVDVEPAPPRPWLTGTTPVSESWS